MQYGHAARKGSCRILMEKVMRVLLAGLLIPLIIAGAIAALPVGLILLAMFVPVFEYHVKYGLERNCRDVMVGTAIVIGSLCVLPITVVLLIFPGSCVAGYMKYKGRL